MEIFTEKQLKKLGNNLQRKILDIQNDKLVIKIKKDYL